MSMRLAYPAIASTLLVIFLPACSFHSSERGAAGSDEHVVTEEEIRASGGTTAWEVMKRTLPGISFRDDRNGNPSRISARGASSILLQDRPNIFIDGIRITDFTRLDQVPASDIAMIRFLNGITGTTRYGTNSGDGVILIYTKNGASSS
jgi:outer membrane cobalamin receptor